MTTHNQSSLQEPVDLGEFWAGDSGPAIPIVFARTGGGYLNCVDAASGKTAFCTGQVRRWDPRRRLPLTAVLQQCVLTEVDPAHGRYVWDWQMATPYAVPSSSGIYVLQVDLIFPSGQEQHSQRALFRVLPSA